MGNQKIRKKSGPKPQPASERFWRKVKKTETCWLWVENKKFYPTFLVHKKTYSVHRFSWEIHFGEIPAGLQVLHKCDNKSCVNPDHLFLGTQRENVYDCIEKGRFKIARGEEKACKITWKQADEIRKIRKEKGLSCLKIGLIFGISRTTVDKIIKNQYWVKKDVM